VCCGHFTQVWCSLPNAPQVECCCSVLQCVAMCCSMLRLLHTSVVLSLPNAPPLDIVAVCCSVLQRVAVCCSNFTHVRRSQLPMSACILRHTDITWDITYRVLSPCDVCEIPCDICVPNVCLHPQKQKPPPPPQTLSQCVAVCCSVLQSLHTRAALSPSNVCLHLRSRSLVHHPLRTQPLRPRRIWSDSYRR